LIPLSPEAGNLYIALLLTKEHAHQFVHYNELIRSTPKQPATSSTAQPKSLASVGQSIPSNLLGYILRILYFEERTICSYVNRNSRHIIPIDNLNVNMYKSREINNAVIPELDTPINNVTRRVSWFDPLKERGNIRDVNSPFLNYNFVKSMNNNTAHENLGHISFDIFNTTNYEGLLITGSTLFKCLNGEFLNEQTYDIDCACVNSMGEYPSNDEFKYIVDKVAARIKSLDYDYKDTVSYSKTNRISSETGEIVKHQLVISGVPANLTIELYKGSIGSIYRHHLGIARGFFYNGTVYVYPSFLITNITYNSPDYRYFGSKIKSPIDIITKYNVKYHYGVLLNHQESYMLKDSLTLNNQYRVSFDFAYPDLRKLSTQHLKHEAFWEELRKKKNAHLVEDPYSDVIFSIGSLIV
jgi:hypothetical protein